MANLRKCGRCRSEIELKYFAINRKGEYNKTCSKCLTKRKKTKPLSAVPCDDDNISTATPDTSGTLEHEPTKKTYKKCIPIDATDVGALLGLNKYKTNLYQLVMKYWERGFPSHYLDTQIKLQSKGVEFVCLKTTDDQIMGVCGNKGISIEFDVLEDVDKLMEQLDKEDDLNVNTEDITSFCNKQMGIQFEKSAIEQYEKRFNVKVDSTNNYVKRLFEEDGLYKWYVGGRIDGVIGFDKIVEIKTRKKGFYPCIPIYEILQIYTYMFAMSINKASLVEKYEDEMKETNFVYSDGYESYALTKLKTFCSFMEEFVNNVDLNEQFMKCNDDDDAQVENINKSIMQRLGIEHMKNAKVSPIKDIITKSEPPIMVFDVEHTGCIYQHILQLSWCLYQHDGTLIKANDYFLQPDDTIYIHPRAIEKHNITHEVLLQKQNKLRIAELLNTFMADVHKCETLVSHNIKSDLNTLNNELRRHNMNDVNVNTYCTMVQTKMFCNCKDKRKRLKNPSLNDLHKTLFNEPLDPTKSHNSCYDVEMCAKCYFKYRNIEI